MNITIQNMFENKADAGVNEQFTDLLSTPGFRIERIVSSGQSTPAGKWLEQEQSEWVLLLQGSAALRFEGDDRLQTMSAGDYLLIPSGCRHRVEWTDQNLESVWLAIHFDQQQ